mgnify:CR=1 FL=1
MEKYLRVGEILKPQGIRGEIKVKPCAADVERFLRWNPLYLGENYRPIQVRVNRIHDGFVYLTPAGSTTMEDAEKYRGQFLYIDREQAAPLAEDEVYIADLLGCRAVDENGQELGTLTDVLQHGPVDIWVFQGSRGQWMAPALKKVFTATDPENGIILTDSEALQEVAVFED